jgi:hypothetical protein
MGSKREKCNLVEPLGHDPTPKFQMPSVLRLLDQVQVAAPCPAKWEEMTGDDRSRHCSMCRLNVYNLSDMSAPEAEAFLRSATGRTCVRYYQRKDGNVMTKDCPRGLRAIRRKLCQSFGLAAAALITLVGCGESGAKLKKVFGIDKFERPAIAGRMILTPPPGLGSTKSVVLPDSSQGS